MVFELLAHFETILVSFLVTFAILYAIDTIRLIRRDKLRFEQENFQYHQTLRELDELFSEYTTNVNWKRDGF